MRRRRTVLSAAFLLLLTGLATSCGFEAVKPSGTVECDDCVLPPGYKIELVAEGLDEPQSLDWLGESTILVTEKKGTVRAVTDGKLRKEPWASIPLVRAVGARGLTGIAVDGDAVFAYYESLPLDASVTPTRSLGRVDTEGEGGVPERVVRQGNFTSGELPMGGLLRVDARSNVLYLEGPSGSQDGNLLRFSPEALKGTEPPVSLVTGIESPGGVTFRPDGGIYFTDEIGNLGYLRLLRSETAISPAPESAGGTETAELPLPVYAYEGLHFEGIEYYSASQLTTFRDSILACVGPGSGLHFLVLDSSKTKVQSDELLSKDCSGDVRTGPDGLIYFVDTVGGRIWRVTDGNS